MRKKESVKRLLILCLSFLGILLLTGMYAYTWIMEYHQRYVYNVKLYFWGHILMVTVYFVLLFFFGVIQPEYCRAQNHDDAVSVYVRQHLRYLVSPNCGFKNRVCRMKYDYYNEQYFYNSVFHILSPSCKSLPKQFAQIQTFYLQNAIICVMI